MTDSDKAKRRAGQLVQEAQDARSRAEAARARTVQVAEKIAAIDDTLAAVMDGLVALEPQEAPRLRAMGETASERAARRRQWAKDLQRIGSPAHGRGLASAPGQAPAEPGSEPEAAASTNLEGRLREMIAMEERDRIAADLQDKVIQRILAAGLTLQGAAAQTEKPEVRRTIQTAIDELDQVIQAVRHAVVNQE